MRESTVSHKDRTIQESVQETTRASRLILIRLSGSWVSSLVPSIIFLFLFATPNAPWSLLLIPVAISFIVNLFSFLSHVWLKTHIVSFGVMLFATALGLIELWNTDTPTAVMGGWVLLNVCVWYRMARTVKAEFLAREIRLGFHVDAVCVLVFAPLFLMFQTGVGMLLRIGGLGMVMAFLLRVQILWTCERKETETKGGRATTLVFALLFMAAAMGLYGWRAVLVAVKLVLFLGFLLLSPLIILLPGTLRVSLLKAQVFAAQQPGQAQNMKISNMPPVQTSHTAPVVLGILVILIITFFTVRSILRKGEVTPRKDLSSPVSAVQRQWVRAGQKRFPWLHTQHPVRQRYQRWLVKVAQAGHPMLVNESPSEYERRLIQSGVSRVVNDQPSRAEYESARYGHEGFDGGENADEH